MQFRFQVSPGPIMVDPGTRQLMDPCGGLRQFLVPLIACVIEQVYVPCCLAWLTQTPGDYFAHLPFRIVEMHHARVGDGLSCFDRRPPVIGCEHLGPDYAHADRRAGKFLKDNLLHRTGAA